MAVIVVTPTKLPGVNAVTGVTATAGSAAMPVTSGTDSYTIAYTGSEIVIVANTTTGALTFTITGTADPQGRVANYSMSVPASAALATVTLMITPRLAAFFQSGAVITIPATNPAGLAILALTGT